MQGRESVNLFWLKNVRVMYFDWNCQLKCEFGCLHFCSAENVDYFSLSPLLQECSSWQSSLQNGSFGLILIARQFRERRTWAEPSSLLIPFHQPVITSQLHLFKGFSPCFSVAEFFSLTSALISLPIFPRSLLLSRAGSQGRRGVSDEGQWGGQSLWTVAVPMHMLAPHPWHPPWSHSHTRVPSLRVATGWSELRGGTEATHQIEGEEKGGRESRNTKPLHHRKHKGRQFQ